ncbi:MAG: hypothetical protein ACUVQS_04700 [Candidatus Bipolaricaulaceae bacterium]
MLISTALAFPIPILFRHIIDELIPQGRFGELSWIAPGLVFLVALRGLFAYLTAILHRDRRGNPGSGRGKRVGSTYFDHSSFRFFRNGR